MVHSCTLQMFLLKEKSFKQIKIIKNFIINSKYSVKDLERLISKLVYISMIVLGSSFFLKASHIVFYNTMNGKAIINENYINNLLLQIEFAKRGLISLSILHMVLRILTAIYFTNTSGVSLRKYFFINSRTQNYKLLEGILKFKTINYLEFFVFLI